MDGRCFRGVPILSYSRSEHTAARAGFHNGSADRVVGAPPGLKVREDVSKKHGKS